MKSKKEVTKYVLTQTMDGYIICPKWFAEKGNYKVIAESVNKEYLSNFGYPVKYK